jgi:hypothetical protein
MIKTRVLKRAAMCVTFFAMAVISVGCTDNKPLAGGGGNVSFKGRTCPGGTQQYEVAIVANSAVFNDPADHAIVVCEGDQVSWSIQSSTGVIKIAFTDPFADQLFGPGNSTFQSHPGNPKSETDKQTVQSQKGHLGQVYKYTIVVEDPAGNQKAKKDPHVIPMGNGGP